MRHETRDANGDLSSIVSRPRAIAQLASGGNARGTANGVPIPQFVLLKIGLLWSVVVYYAA